MATASAETGQRASQRHAIADCDVHSELDSVRDLFPYLSTRWRRQLETAGVRGYQGGGYPRFWPNREDARPPSGRTMGSEAGFTCSHYLDPYNVRYAILIPLAGAGVQPNLDFSAALASAINDWIVNEWLDRDPRFRASMTVAVEDPQRAVGEIERRAADRRFVQVLFPGRPREPMGRPKYWPIYEACSAHGLSVATHAAAGGSQPITGAGWPSYYVEDHVSPAQSMQANVTSMIVEGVFERFPTLKLVSVENGFGWLPSLMWRLDAAYELFSAEVPHLSRRPSEYVRGHVYLATQPMEEPRDPRHFEALLEHCPELAEQLVFASDYPHWDGDSPDTAFPARLPDGLERAILCDNARRLYELA